MPEQRFVNRVNNTFLENELKKIEPPTEPEVDTTPAIEAKTEYRVPPHVGETVVLQPEQTAVYTERDEQYLKPAGNEELLASFRALVGGEDFKVFRSQVIRAFKHQGVDTKRFFGE